MALKTNQITLASIARECQEKHRMNNQSRDATVRRINEGYFTQLLEEKEGRVTKKGLRSLVGWRVEV